MCKSASCDKCQKSTWWGCGLHVPSVMDKLPKEEWCTCEPKVEKEGGEGKVGYPPMKGTAG
ncbi:hypothetical protein BDR22DRAFT_860500 [Usnea florida]